ncbi:Amidase 1 [Colletotrichum aenigma]|uniref:Amidase 1 n=1 Tax=Colletotrichum aenigma TaxID=1215731 RepID=UPI0018729ED6|nr:Amidase 1 [Colletotrichum aenigma]KAF5520759.1 Amidase 1 [Colletotrichum aenigma]
MKMHPAQIFVVAALPFAASQIISTGSTLLLNGIPYFISPHVAANISLQSDVPAGIDGVFDFVPVAVLPTAPASQADNISDIFTAWTETDDVFQSGFTQLLLNGTIDAETSTAEAIHTAGETPSTVVSFTSSSNVPKGPYFLRKATGDLHKAYRLYDDTAGAFTEALLYNNDGTFQVLPAKIPGSATFTIGVPSRLYYEPSDSKPLAGVRIAVKDIFSLAGAKQSNGNRAWYHLYPANNVTGTAISRLIEAGAIIVGTQKLSQFATSEVATVDWVDYHSPFNPRGDGYQDPSSSSSGAGASVGSYSWLDAAVGTDTGGSIRSPAGVNGVFGNRASHGAVSSDHIMPLSEPLDTVGFLVRDPKLWDKLQAVTYGSNYTSLATLQPKYPTKIMTVSYPNSSTEAGVLLNNFAAALAKFVGGNVGTLNVAQQWGMRETNPNADLNFTETFNITYPVLTGKGQDDAVVQPFYADYAKQFDGRRPFINPSPLARWAWAANYSWDEAMQNKTMFMDWFNDQILPPVNDSLQCSSGLILYAGKTGTQSPRNRYDIALPAPFTGFSAARMSVFSGCPDLIYPVGEVSSFSALTNHDEKLPVAVGILAAKGCDGLLSRLAIDLVNEGILKVPEAGGTLSGGQILV